MSGEIQQPPEIQSHKLTFARQKPSQNHGGYLVNPTLLLIHYTAGFSLDGAVATLCDMQANIAPADRKRRSAHCVVGHETGEVVQLVPFNTVAWHAGESEWKGRKQANFFSIGIELDNPGWLIKSADGRWVSKDSPKHVYADTDVVVAKHKYGGPVLGWAKYSQAQLDSLDRIARAVKKAYPTVLEAAGHEDVAPTRKKDPGPAFPMAAFQARIFGHT